MKRREVLSGLAVAAPVTALVGIKWNGDYPYDYALLVEKDDHVTGQHVRIGIRPDGEVEFEGASVSEASRVFWDALGQELRRRGFVA